MDPTTDYLYAAASCVRAVAIKEQQPADEIEHEVGIYRAWAEAIDPDLPPWSWDES